MNILQRGNFSSPAVQSKALSKQDENLPIRNINLEEYGTTQTLPSMTKLENCTKRSRKTFMMLLLGDGWLEFGLEICTYIRTAEQGFP